MSVQVNTTGVRENRCEQGLALLALSLVKKVSGEQITPPEIAKSGARGQSATGLHGQGSRKGVAASHTPALHPGSVAEICGDEEATQQLSRAT